jgi:hypothetical protein
MSQQKAILEHMREHGSLTSFESFEQHGITRLGSVIHKLRSKGYEIVSERERALNGNFFARYYLVSEPTADD